MKEESGLSYKKLSNSFNRWTRTLNIVNSRKVFPRLKVVAYRINEILSMNVAYMDKMAKHNNGFKYLIVAVDVLSRYLRVQLLITMYSKDCVEAFKQMINTKQPEKVWTDKGTEIKGEFKTFCENIKIHLYTTENETKSAFAEKNIQSIKIILYRHLKEKWNYITKLPNFVHIISSRVNSVTKWAPNQVFKKHELFLVSIALNNAININHDSKRGTWYK